jgi:hypothetical protein
MRMRIAYRASARFHESEVVAADTATASGGDWQYGRHGRPIDNPRRLLTSHPKYVDCFSRAGTSITETVALGVPAVPWQNRSYTPVLHRQRE